MEAVLIFSHGSVLCGAERNLLELAKALEASSGEIVEAGFLNYSEPDFDTAVARCVDRGATRITIAPYFLVAGKFVSTDLPPRIASAVSNHPGLRFIVAEAFRFHPRLADAVLAMADRAVDPAFWRGPGAHAEEFCRESPSCPLFGSPECPSTERRAKA